MSRAIPTSNKGLVPKQHSLPFVRRGLSPSSHAAYRPLHTGEALVTSLEPLPDVEFVLQTGDTGLVAGAPWVLGRKEAEEQLTLMPGPSTLPRRFSEASPILF